MEYMYHLIKDKVTDSQIKLNYMMDLEKTHSNYKENLNKIFYFILI